MYSANILNVKKIILNSDVADIAVKVSKILRTGSRERIYELVEQLNEDIELF